MLVTVLCLGWLGGAFEWVRAQEDGFVGRPSSGYHERLIETGSWTFQADGQTEVVSAAVPEAWESFLGTDFDGSGTYRWVLDPASSAEIDRWKASVEQVAGPQGLYLVFDGVATQAQVKINGQSVGEHLGPWTPWACQVDSVWTPAAANVVEVHVDEKVGHHTQGFLPVFLPHFGGIWQAVRWELRPESRIEFEQSLLLGTVAPELVGGPAALEVDLKLSGPLSVGMELSFSVGSAFKLMDYRSDPCGFWVTPTWQHHPESEPVEFSHRLTPEQVAASRVRLRLPVRSAQPWSPASPWLYAVKVRLHGPPPSGEVVHEAVFRTGFRHYETDGHQLKLNGQPLIVQGLLNWGYAPPSLAPSLIEFEMLLELKAAQELGLNLMKFCLWLPPKRYLELADEMGMLTWVEYPTWHAQLIPANLDELSREYEEFTNFDRNHPSVVLRSLTCETGPSADLTVIQHLYDLVHRQVPGAIVEDDSSWISWNRVSDIWDDHPYGNNHTWVATLDRLKQFIAQRTAKPLILGEAIAADTWPQLSDMVERAEFFLERHPRESRPFWYFGFLEAAQQFEQRLETLGYGATRDRLLPDSVRYAFLMRKFQIEAYRREVPWGGYVLSVIRDFPFAAMGLLDSWGNSKFPSWNSAGEFQVAETMVVLHTPEDRRSWYSNQLADLTLMLPTPDDLPTMEDPGLPARLKWRLWAVRRARPEEKDEPTRELIATEEVVWDLRRPNSLTGTSADHPQQEVSLRFPSVAQLTEFTFEVDVEYAVANATREARNQWSFWAVPETAVPTSPELIRSRSQVDLHSNLAPRARDWFGQPPLSDYWDMTAAEGEPSADNIVVASRFDLDLLDRLEAGATVLMLPDGGPRSLPKQSNWFLRGAPLLFEHPLYGTEPVERWLHQAAMIDLQHFDLAGDVQPRFHYWEEGSPVVGLWDNHDIKEVLVHGLMWEAKVGQGRLAVSYLDHDPQRSAFGPYVLQRLLRHLRPPSEPSSPPRSLAESSPARAADGASAWAPKAWSQALRERLRSDLVGQDVNLVTAEWRLQPDPEQIGFRDGWAGPDHDASDWKPIRIDAHWEGQGFPQLDGWAWYSTEVTVPEDWPSPTAYLCFTGVDDHYQAFVNGQAIGQAGVIETKQTAFEMRTSHRIPGEVQPGERLIIRVAVYDWYGAGGIFRPIFLRSTPLSDLAPLLNN